MLSVEIIPFRNFQEKLAITKKHRGKAKIEIIDNKYVLILRRKSMNNKKKIKEQVHSFIEGVIDKADADEKLDFFQIEISNHQGNLQMDYSLRDRKKVY